jgi:Transposase DDE domain
VPAVPSCLLEPIWVEVCALIGGERPPYSPAHPLGCHRRRISDRVVFEHVVAALVHGSGYERIATAGCSDRTIRRRLNDWAERGIGQQVHALALQAYDQVIGLELADVAVDGCITKAPCGGPLAGPSPVDRRKGGLKRSAATEAAGIPLGITAAGANRHDSPLLAPTLQAAISQLGTVLPDQPTCHLDAAYDGAPARQTLAELGFHGQIACLGIPAPIQATKRWPAERTHSWMNGYGKLRRMTDRNPAIVIFYLYLAAAFITIRRLIQQARTRYRWDTRPTTKRLK